MYQGVNLSATERAQLGSVRRRKDGTPSAHPYPSADQWPTLRAYLVERSRKANPLLDGSLTAYTPGETLALLEHPEIKAWHEHAAARIAGYETVVLVPCAKTKPWVEPYVSRSKLYTAYHALKRERPDICFATVSEPLGIVSMEDWGSFPQYDNPGLFKDDAQQSGMTKRDWEASPFGRWYGLPFDEEAWSQSIEHLGAVVGSFLTANAGKQLISVVDSAEGPQSTHGAMLDAATCQSGVEVTRYPKRLEARVSPLDYLRDVFDGKALESRLSARPSLSKLERAPVTPEPPAPALAGLGL